MTKEIGFVYFDVAGVIFKLQERISNLATILNLPDKDVRQAYYHYDELACRGGLTPQELWTNMLVDLDVKNNPIPDFGEYWAGQRVVMGETVGLLSELVDQGVPVGLITNAYLGLLDMAFEKKQLPRLPFAAIIESCNVGILKPELPMWTLAERRAGIRKKDNNRILLVDDGLKNVEGAKKRGWQGFLFSEQDPAASVWNLRQMLLS